MYNLTLLYIVVSNIDEWSVSKKNIDKWSCWTVSCSPCYLLLKVTEKIELVNTCNDKSATNYHFDMADVHTLLICCQNLSYFKHVF